MVLGGVAQEMQGQMHLLQTGGIDQLAGYMKVMEAQQLGIGEWFKSGLLGKLPAFGSNLQARGAVATAVGPALATASISLARGFTNMRETLAAASQKLGIADIGRSSQVAHSVAAPELGRKQGSPNELSASLQSAKLALWGADKAFVEPDYEKGLYAGRVLGETAHHLLVGVDGRANTATALEKTRLGAIAPVNQILKVQFRDGTAVENGLSKVKSRSL